MNDTLFDKNYKRKTKRGKLFLIRNHDRNSRSLNSEKLPREKGLLKSCLDDYKNFEERSWRTEKQETDRSKGWRSPSENCKDSEESSWRSPSDDCKNSEKLSWRAACPPYPGEWASPSKEWRNSEKSSRRSSSDNSKNSEKISWRVDSPPEEWRYSEKSSWRSSSDNSKNSEKCSWRFRHGLSRSTLEEKGNSEKASGRSPSDDCKNLEKHGERFCPGNLKCSEGRWTPQEEWGNSEKSSKKSTAQKNCAFSNNCSPVEESQNTNESGVCSFTDSKIAFDQSHSKAVQETDSENKKDFTNQISDGNFGKEIDTIYDTSNNFTSDFLSALEKNIFPDVSIKCEDYVREVHKFALAARSPVFEAMFSTPMEESEKGVVTINDIDPSVLDDLLAFIYGAQVKNMTLSKACDLLYVAEKYQVKGLKDICTNYLRSCLSIPNAIQILQFADLYDEELKKNVLNYVCENFSALKITEEWKALQSQKPKLSIDVYSLVVEKHDELLGSKNSDCPKGTPTSTSSTSWTCRFCTFSNKSQDTFCDECSIPR